MKRYFVLIILWLGAGSVFAQEQVVHSNTNALDIHSMYTQNKKSKSVAYYYRHHKTLPARYSGYIIEIKRSDFPLQRDHQLFKHFGSVRFDHLSDGSYSYGITVDFSTRYEMKKYLKEVVLPKADEAKIVRYKNGNRKNNKT